MESEAFLAANQRGCRTVARLVVLPDQPVRLSRLVRRVEMFLWMFIRLRWYDIHLFFASVEPKEAMELSHEHFSPGLVLSFLSERQTEEEWEDTMTVGLSLLFAAMRQATRRGFNPKTAGIFTLQRMMEQAIEPVQDLEDLLSIGAPLT